MSPVILLVALVAIAIWGGSPVAAKMAVDSMSPISVSVLRTVLAGAITLPLALALGIKLPASWHQRGLLLVSGFCGFVALATLLTIGVTMTSANHASMILAALPLSTGAIALFWDRKRPQRNWLIGCAIALLGEVLLISGDSGTDTLPASVRGDLIILFANLFASLGYVCGARLQQSGYASIGTTFWGVTIWSIILLPLVPLVTSFEEIQNASTFSLVGLAYLVLAVTVIAYIMWYWALGKGGIARIGALQFLQPITGVIAAAWILHEGITSGFALASMLILAGVWIALKSK